MPALEIIGAPQSNYVWVVRMVCEEKGVPYEHKTDRPHTPNVDAIHPFGKIPVMRHGAVELCESKAIATYIDRVFDGPKVIVDAVDRRQVGAEAQAHDGQVGDRLEEARRQARGDGLAPDGGVALPHAQGSQRGELVGLADRPPRPRAPRGPPCRECPPEPTVGLSSIFTWRNRLERARWMVRNNPMVKRIWQ